MNSFVTIVILASLVGKSLSQWQAFGEFQYFVGGTVNTYFQAKQTCIASDATLVEVKNRNIQDFLVGIIGSASEYPTSYYIGLTKFNATVGWVWSDSSLLVDSDAQWKVGEPNNLDHGDHEDDDVDEHSGEQCVIMGWLHEVDPLYKWIDIPCAEFQSRYICQRRLPETTTTLAATTTPATTTTTTVPTTTVPTTTAATTTTTTPATTTTVPTTTAARTTTPATTTTAETTTTTMESTVIPTTTVPVPTTTVALPRTTAATTTTLETTTETQTTIPTTEETTTITQTTTTETTSDESTFPATNASTVTTSAVTTGGSPATTQLIPVTTMITFDEASTETTTTSSIAESTESFTDETDAPEIEETTDLSTTSAVEGGEPNKLSRNFDPTAATENATEADPGSAGGLDNPLGLLTSLGSAGGAGMVGGLAAVAGIGLVKKFKGMAGKASETAYNRAKAKNKDFINKSQTVVRRKRDQARRDLERRKGAAKTRVAAKRQRAAKSLPRKKTKPLSRNRRQKATPKRKRRPKKFEMEEDEAWDDRDVEAEEIYDEEDELEEYTEVEDDEDVDDEDYTELEDEGEEEYDEQDDEELEDDYAEDDEDQEDEEEPDFRRGKSKNLKKLSPKNGKGQLKKNAKKIKNQTKPIKQSRSATETLTKSPRPKPVQKKTARSSNSSKQTNNKKAGKTPSKAGKTRTDKEYWEENETTPKRQSASKSRQESKVERTTAASKTSSRASAKTVNDQKQLAQEMAAKKKKANRREIAELEKRQKPLPPLPSEQETEIDDSFDDSDHEQGVFQPTNATNSFSRDTRSTDFRRDLGTASAVTPNRGNHITPSSNSQNTRAAVTTMGNLGGARQIITYPTRNQTSATQSFQGSFLNKFGTGSTDASKWQGQASKLRSESDRIPLTTYVPSSISSSGTDSYYVQKDHSEEHEYDSVPVVRTNASSFIPRY